MNFTGINQLWVYLAGSPLLSLFLTIGLFAGSFELVSRVRWLRFIHPAVLTIVVLILLLVATKTPYPRYFEGAQFIHFLLGPATVVLAVPLFDNLSRVRAMLMPLVSSCVFGVFMAIVFTVTLSIVTGAPEAVSISLAPKSVTTPIAMGISGTLGGIPELTAAMVLVTGVLGCLTAPIVFKVLRIHDHTVKGFTLGLTAHGFGTAQSFAKISALAGAFSGLAMGIAGVTTAIMMPLLMPLFGLH